MRTIELSRRGWAVGRGLRRLVKHPVEPGEAALVVADEVRRRPERFLASLDELVWPFAASPTRRLLECAGLERRDVRRLVLELGLDDALSALHGHGVYVSYEEYHGRREARRGSASLSFSPADFFNPVTAGDYLATTGGSRGTGTPVELSFAWQRRQGVQRAIQLPMAGVLGAPSAIWLPVFPSGAGFGAIMKNAAGGNRPDRWFSQIPDRMTGVTGHKQLANRFLPALNALARTGLPAAEHVPTDRPERVVRWLRGALDAHGRASLIGYASSLTAAARWAVDAGIDLTGSVAFPSSEPVTGGKLDAMRAAGMRPYPMYAFVPEGTVALTCDGCEDEEYHLWDHDVAVSTRRRSRGDGIDVDAFLWTSLAAEAPRVLVNVENDDYGSLRRGVSCSCRLGELGLETRIAHIRGISKVVAAGISLDGEIFDHLAEVALPERLGGGPGDFQFVEGGAAAGTTVTLRIHPRVGAVDEAAAVAAVRAVLATTDNGRLAERVWMPRGHLPIARTAPAVTASGKTLSYERPVAAATSSCTP